MKAAQISEYGGVEKIVINEVDKPTAGEGQILVENYAASINPFDFVVLAGRVQKMMTLPATLGGDFAGKVYAVSPNVSTFKVGDEVFGSALILNGGSGSMAEFAFANAKNSAKKPKNLNFEEAGSLPLVGSSAVQALEDHIKLQSGQKILIHGGAGGIGSIAIQVAKALGAYVATTVSTNDIEFARGLGADEVIDFKNEDFTQTIKGFDAVFSTAGGEVVEKSFGVLKKDGILVSMTGIEQEDLAKKYGVVAIAQMTDTNDEHLKRVAELVENGIIKPKIDRVFPLFEAQKAFEYQESGSPRGKVVIKIQ